MSHNRTLGRFFVTHIGASGSETLIQLAKSSEITFKNKLNEVTDVGDNGWEGYLDGIRGWTAKLELNYDQDDTEIASIIDNLIDPSKDTDVSCIIGQQTTTGDIAWTGTAKIPDTPISASVDGVITMTLTLQGTGGLTKVTTS